jgi:hypothetical protein
MAKCVLCEQESKRFKEQRSDGYAVECETCGRYFLDAPEIFEGGYINMPREKRAMISAYTRELFEQGKERPELEDDELLAGIIEEYEGKTDDQKLENFILFLRKRSKQFRDLVEVNKERYYPITYSLSEEGLLAILKLGKERGLLTEETPGTVIRLTEAGWKIGTNLIKTKAG